ncbi:hypothetical protein [Clostridium formicaceticum]|uniref:Uncharacterized protein n=1 Tax=Clostridium formicaceticum TaxID=1497 RepID=A0AAC9WFN5_9CLOT|nr:hypothetical protein [Clostridium formicaceticum]AOY76673.1 hypothetical protein BJL90_12835 [Clostridium formicaceticum]ARE87102.1 hypothetical protein CLFO_14880 [Clostridium formicaceticum]
MKKKILISVCSICILLLLFARLSRPNEITYNIELPQNELNTDISLNQQLNVYKNEVEQMYRIHLDVLDKRFNMFLMIIGIAVTTWIGLNIYNAVEKMEVDMLKRDKETLKADMEAIKLELIDVKSQYQDYTNRLAEIKNEYERISEEIEKLKEDGVLAKFG